jgi:hypothetical protein
MAELKNSGFGMYRGHPIEGITIERELYWLAVAFAGSRGLHDLTPDEKNHELDSLRLHFETSEVSRLLISVAVMLRNLMDASSPEHIELLIRKRDMVVGHYFTGKQRRKKELIFREACHKVIHALHVNFDLAGTKKNKLGYLRPVVHLYGEFHGEDWRAVLDVMKFIAIAYRLS